VSWAGENRAWPTPGDQRETGRRNTAAPCSAFRERTFDIEYMKEISEAMQSRTAQLTRRACAAAAAVTLTAALAACGSSTNSGNTASAGTAGSSASSSGTATGSGGASTGLSATISKLEVRPTSIGITTPIGGGVPKGKSIVYLECAIPDCAQLRTGLQITTAKLGWSLTSIGIGTTPESIAAAWQAALQKSPDAIVNSGGYPTAYYQSELSQAVARKIPLVTFAQKDEGGPWTASIGSGQGLGRITANIAAEYVASKISAGPVLAVTIPGVGVVEDEIAEFQQQLPHYCPKCSVNVLQIPPASVGTTDAASRIASYLQSNPNTKFIFLSTIDLDLGLQSALAATGGQAPPIVAQTTSAVGLDAIQNHQGTLEATTEYPSFDGAYRAIDALARFFRGQSVQPDSDATLPQWLITASNVTSERPLPAVKDYASQYYALWGVK
jgi:ABC-type sugar transport system substrate-binding protein